MRKPKILQHLRRNRALAGLAAVLLLSVHVLAQQYNNIVTDHARPLLIARVTAHPHLSDFEGMDPASALARQLTRVVGFTARVPVDDLPASEPTEVYLGYDAENLYAVFACHDSQPQKMRARLPKRDDVFDDDSITIQLDTFHDQHRAYSFGVNAGGIQGDGVWVEGTGWDLSFDAVYSSEVRRSEQGYIALLAVPFRSFRFPSGPNQHWGIILNRYIARTTEDTFWPRYSTKVQGRLNQMAELEIPSEVTAGRNLQFIPYVAFTNSHTVNDRDLPNVSFRDRAAEVRVGLDAKAVLHDKLVFDVTANPDFSQVESDDPQVQVNQRFELFFPEKRHFFIENASYFSTPVNLLFTRRIQKPDAGVRMTGKLGPWGLGTLVTDDRGPGEIVPSIDPDAGKRALFAVGRATHDLGKQSFVGAMFARRSLGSRTNSNYSLDGLWKINANWRATMQGIFADTQDVLVSRHGSGLDAAVYHDGAHIIGTAEYKSFSPGFEADSGFVPRVDIRNLASSIYYKFLREKGVLVDWGPKFIQTSTWDTAGNPLDFLNTADMKVDLRRNTFLEAWYDHGSTYLRPIDFAGLPGLTQYPIWHYGFFAQSTPSNALTFTANLEIGRTVNFSPASGQLPTSARSLTSSSTVALRPRNGLTITNDYLFTQLSEENTSRNILLDHIVRSRWLFQFDPRWSLRLTGQYNALLPTAALTSDIRTKEFNGDALLTYRVNQGTAVYVGYNHDLQNLDPRLRVIDGHILRTQNSLQNDGRVFFVKVSYLFHY